MASVSPRPSVRAAAPSGIADLDARAAGLSQAAPPLDPAPWPRPAPPRGYILWLTGLSGAGKTTLATALRAELRRTQPVEILDGDEVRAALAPAAGFSRAERDANVQRLGWLARRFAGHGVAVLVAAISPYRAARDEVRQAACADGVPFIEVFLDAPIEALAARDPKGLYRRACAGELGSFTGISDPYEAPPTPEVVVHTATEPVEDSLARILAGLVVRRLWAPRQEA